MGPVVPSDELARLQLQAGTNVNYAAGPGVTVGTAGQPPTARNQITPLDTLRAYDIRFNVAALEAQQRALDTAGITCRSSTRTTLFDLWMEAGNQALIAPHIYSAPEEVFRGEVGAFAGARFIETPTAPVFADAGSSTTDTDVVRHVVPRSSGTCEGVGDQGRQRPLASAFVMGPITYFQPRFHPLGWKWMGAYGVFPTASNWRCASRRAVHRSEHHRWHSTPRSKTCSIDLGGDECGRRFTLVPPEASIQTGA